VNIKEASEQS